MKIKNIFSDVLYIEPKNHNDERGFFRENFNFRDLKEKKILFNSVQDNFSSSKKKGTIRGLHFQTPPYEQSKIIYVISGEIFDVFVDLRKNSKNYGKYSSMILSEDSGFLLIPRGFAHGFCTLKDNTKVMYKVDNYYNKESDSGIIWNDSFLNIDWPKLNTPFLISQKDKNLNFFNSL
ncbi:MAG: dTDP-4-dehydrorhamnose 3,5-epimerase [Gammaproteobacteria bacterium]|jgi:dTDP-4-dehydrorhamnose 3,5-epimerase|nr:dTDP-4-dehydrorhamnose 3,5-epimerase [Gammaproteobacteria bacterium]|tara:strand:- start:166 stop:699 length:534 start_codon:yes stop_codon:yes gene_type:complete